MTACLARAAALTATVFAAVASAQTLSVTPASLSFAHQTGQPIPPQQTIAVSATTTLNTTITTGTSDGRSWLFVNPISGATPYTLSVIVLPTGLSPGNYSGTITITAAGATNSPVAIPVSLIVSDSPVLIANPASLTFTFSMGGTPPPSQAITLSSTTAGVAFSAAASTASGGNWLNVAPNTGTTPGSLTVSVTTGSLTVGTYTGSVIIAAAGAANSPLTIPVTLRILDEIRLSVNPAALSFDFQIGGPAPPDRVLSISTTGAPVNFTAAAETSSGGNWLVISAAAGTTPANITVSANPAGLQAGTYNGAITIMAGGATNSPLTVLVSLRVTLEPLLTATPGSLTFTFQPGGPPAPRQAILVTNLGASLAFTMAVATSSGGPWLSALPSGAATPATLLVGVSAATVTAGTYQGSITITAQGAANSPLTIPVTLIVSATPVLRLDVNHLAFQFQTGGSNPASRSVSVTSTGTPLSFTASAATAGGGNWLAVAPPSGSTPAQLAVSINAAGLAPGLYAGTVTVVSAEAGATPISIPVRLTVSATPLLVVTPGPLSFSFTVGGSLPTNQALTIASTGAALTFSTGTVTTTASNWIVLAPAAGTTPSTLTVNVNTFGLAEGSFTGVITVSAAGVANSPQHVPVIVTISTVSEINVSPAPLSFTQVTGAAAVPSQTLNVTSTGIILSFSAAASTLSGGNWLSVTPTGGLTPGSVTVSVNAAGLDPGIYAGSITITSAAATNSPRIVPVTLTVTRPAPAISLSRDSLTFTAVGGGQAPPSQTVQITSSGEPFAFTIAAATASGGPWLSVSPASGSAPATLNVSAALGSLPGGTYTGTITVSSATASNSPRTISVTLVVSAVAAPSLTAFVNGASFLPSAAVPGLMVSLGGSNIGPSTPAGLRLTPAGTVDTTVAGTRVLFDNIPAPLIYVSANQINAVVPYALGGRLSTRVEVEVSGVRSNAIELRVADASPGIFTLNASGSGQGAILNQDFSVNGAANAAPRDSVIQVYATGEGQTFPAGADGLVITTLLKRPLLPVRARIGGMEADVEYSGSAPTFVSGTLQLNIRVPRNAPTGPAIPIDFTVGVASSQFGVTVAIR